MTRSVIALNGITSKPAAASPLSTDSAPQRLRLLSYNIQTGISTSRYRHYLTHSWKHVLPHADRVRNLNEIARLISEFDFVGLQEVDAGSLRSGFVNLSEYLAMQGGFPHWYDQTNRNLGKIAQHSIGFLSRYEPTEVVEHRLPGMIPGRGVLSARYGEGENSLVVMILHLALGRRARLHQLDYVRELLAEHRHAIVMGDLNCHSDAPELKAFLHRADLLEPTADLFTYPSWSPSRNIDHILVSSSLQVQATEVLDRRISDHLPITMDVILPAGLRLSTANTARAPAARRRSVPESTWATVSRGVANLFSPL